MNNRVIRLLLKKELLDVFRDRKAVMMLILVPLILYPLIFFAAFAVFSVIESSMVNGEYKVLVEVDDDGALVYQIEKYNVDKAKEAKKNLEKNNEKNNGGTSAGTRILVKKYSDFEVSSEKSHQENIHSLLQNEDIDLYVSSEVKNGKLVYTTTYLSSVTNSNYSESVMREILNKLSEESMKEQIKDAGLDPEEITHPFEIKRQNVASKEQSAGSILGSILPFMLIISLLMGTMYPAIDATAGEKERGTLETLLTLPVKNHEIIVAKFVTVAIMGIISAILNMLSITAMIIYIVKLFQSQMAEGLGLSFDNIRVSTFVPALLVTVLAVLAFSLFISAVTMCITAFAKSYKEANNYITPLTLIVMLTAYIGFIPNISLDGNMALVPVVNICLLIKELLLFKASIGNVALVLLSNILYAILAILFLSKIYDSEGVLFDEGRSGLQLFQKRSNMEKGGAPTTGDAWFLICFVFIVYLYAGSMLQLNYGMAGVFYSLLIIAGIPVIYAIYTRKSLKKTFSFRGFTCLKLLASIILFGGVFFIVNIITLFLEAVFPEQSQTVNTGLADILVGDNIWLSIFIVAIAPAICEELFFRGFILSGFRSKYRIVTSVVLTSLAFGAYHTSLIRFLPTTLLGAALGIVLYYTDSIFISMFLHFINNLVGVIAMYNPEQVEYYFPLLSSQSLSFPGSVVVMSIGIVLVLAGLWLLETINKVSEA